MLLERFFDFRGNHTNFRTELLAGLTTFASMVYIITVNPGILSGFVVNSPLWNGIFLATCLSAGLGTLLAGLLSNKPLALAPGMGINTYFALVTVSVSAMLGISYRESYQACLTIIILEGVLFLLLTLLHLREKIVDAIPKCLRIAIAPAIGLFIMKIALTSNVSLFSEKGGPFFMGSDFFGAVTVGYAADGMGSAFPKMYLSAASMLTGFFAMAALYCRKVIGAIPLGMAIGAAVYWAGALTIGETPAAVLENSSWLPPVSDFLDITFFRFDLATFFRIGWDTALILIVTFCLVDLFDTVGMLISTSSKTNLLNEKRNMNRAMLSDALATVSGGLAGTSTVTTFAETNSGIATGGRTGFTAAVVAVLFLMCSFLAPLAALIPAPATSAVLLFVGILMFAELKNIDFSDMEEFAPAMVMIAAMPVFGSVGHAIGLGIISYAIIRICCGRWREVSWVIYVASVLFIIKFFFTF